MGLTLFDNCRASVSDSKNRRIPAQWKDRTYIVAAGSLIIASFLLTPFLPAQDTNKDVDDPIQEATESAKKMGVKMPDVKKQIEEVN
jgi:hypothetical protein